MLKKKDPGSAAVNRTQSLKKQETTILPDVMGQGGKNKKKFKLNATDYQGRDIFTLPL